MNNQVGKTTEELPVIDGALLFLMRDSQGVSLEDALFYFKNEYIIVDWLAFIKSAQTAGWKKKKIESTISSAIKIVYGNEYFKEFDKKFQEALGVL